MICSEVVPFVRKMKINKELNQLQVRQVRYLITQLQETGDAAYFLLLEDLLEACAHEGVKFSPRFLVWVSKKMGSKVFYDGLGETKSVKRVANEGHALIETYGVEGSRIGDVSDEELVDWDVDTILSLPVHNGTGTKYTVSTIHNLAHVHKVRVAKEVDEKITKRYARGGNSKPKGKRPWRETH